jgi:hypothetical protein
VTDVSDDSLTGKLIMSAVVILLTPFTEIATGAAPIGSIGAVVALAAIWGFEEEAEAITEGS